MLDFLRRLFDTDFMPHGTCYLWRPEIIWLHVLSDAIIAAAYYSIPVALLQFRSRRKDLPFDWMFLLFGGFIFACGTTHLLSILMLWVPAYRVDGIVKLGTAALSLVTAVLLWPLIPKAVALPSPAQLAGLNLELELRAAQMEASNAELTAFNHAVSHDLRAPLRSISGFSDALLQECGASLDENGRRHIARVQAATLRMSQLIDALLGLSRLSLAPMRSERVDLGAFARRIADELRAAEPGRRVTFTIADDLVVRGDGRLLLAVIENLLRNAWKFSRHRPQAHIELGRERRDGRRVFFVRDDGAGFDMAFAGNLFIAFQRLHRSDEFEGTGIGLATVARILHRHGGRIWAEAAVNAGATFFFTLPEWPAPPG